jgi:hypothetical protein
MDRHGPSCCAAAVSAPAPSGSPALRSRRPHRLVRLQPAILPRLARLRPRPLLRPAIEIRTATPGYPPHPGWHNPWVSFLFFIKCAELDAAALAWGTTLLISASAGAAWAWLINPRFRNIRWTPPALPPHPLLRLLHRLGISPHLHARLVAALLVQPRYGMELLPAFALCLGFLAHFAFAAVREFKPRWRFTRRRTPLRRSSPSTHSKCSASIPSSTSKAPKTSTPAAHVQPDPARPAHLPNHPPQRRNPHGHLHLSRNRLPHRHPPPPEPSTRATSQSTRAPSPPPPRQRRPNPRLRR